MAFSRLPQLTVEEVRGVLKLDEDGVGVREIAKRLDLNDATIMIVLFKWDRGIPIRCLDPHGNIVEIGQEKRPAPPAEPILATA